MKTILVLLFTLGSFCLSEKAHATFISDSLGNLLHYDQQTNSAQLIGNAGVGAFFDIALNPLDGELYGITGYRRLYRIDQHSGSAAFIGTASSFINALAFNNQGQLFGTGYGSLFEVSIFNGASTLLGYGNYHSSGDLAFDNLGQLFLTSKGDQLMQIDTTSGSGSLIGNIGYDGVYGLTFENQQLFGFTSDGRTLAIDRDSGVGTQVASNGFVAYGATARSIPEPTTLLLLVTGLGAITLMRKKKFNFLSTSNRHTPSN